MKKGILRIVPVIFGSKEPQIGLLAKNIDGVYNIPQTEEDCMKSAQWFGNKRVHYMVTEPQSIHPIEIGDFVYDVVNNGIEVANAVSVGRLIAKPDDFENILVHTDEFSMETLKAIVDRTLCEGDSVIVTQENGFVITKDNEKDN